jgi:hypothetical protein
LAEVDGTGARNTPGNPNSYLDFTDVSNSAPSRPRPGHAGSPRVVETLRGLTADGSMKTLRFAAHSLGSALAMMLAIDAEGNGVFKRNCSGS